VLGTNVASSIPATTARRGSTMKPVTFPDEAERDIEFPSLNNALLTVRQPSRQRLVRLIAQHVQVHETVAA
jgi:hypothetical protein